MYKIFDKLFSELKEVLDLDAEFACHKVSEGRICPVYKNDTTEVGLCRWKEFHDQNPVYIKNDEILTEIISENKSIGISNLDEDGRNYPCFKTFNIKSIYGGPIEKDNTVVAIIVIAVLNDYYEFTKEKIEKCNDIIKKYNDVIVGTIL